MLEPASDRYEKARLGPLGVRKASFGQHSALGASAYILGSMVDIKRVGCNENGLTGQGIRDFESSSGSCGQGFELL